jgi:hypothetical protein
MPQTMDNAIATFFVKGPCVKISFSFLRSSETSVAIAGNLTKMLLKINPLECMVFVVIKFIKINYISTDLCAFIFRVLECLTLKIPMILQNIGKDIPAKKALYLSRL